MGEEQEVGRRGLEYVAAGARQGTGRPALRRGVGEQTCLFSNFTQGEKMLESRPEDALGSLVDTVETVERL